MSINRCGAGLRGRPGRVEKGWGGVRMGSGKAGELGKDVRVG